MEPQTTAPEKTQTAPPTTAPTPGARLFSRMHISQLLPLLVFAVSLLLTQQLWKDAQQTVMQDLQAEFDFGVREAGIHIKQRMAAHEQVLRGAPGLFGASVNVDRKEFKAYISHLKLDESYVGIDGMGFSQIVPQAVKSQHIAAIRKQGFPDYTIKPEGERNAYTPVVYIEPFSGRNLRIFGFDPFAEPEHRTAMERARDFDRAAITSKVKLERGADSGAQASIVMYMPVYRTGALYTSRADRRANIVGWVFAPFSMSNLMSGIIGEHTADFDIELYDGTQITDEMLLSDDDTISISKKPNVLFKTAINLDIAGRNWIMLVSSHPAFEARLNNGKPRFVANIGICVSLLLTLLVWLLARGRMRAMQAAQGLKWELAARKKIQIALQESEERWRFALEGGRDGVWDWNIQTGETHYSKRWKEILGCYENETWNNSDEGMKGEWMTRIHPEDKPSVLADLQAHFDKKTTTASCEFRMLCNGDKWKWVHCRGMVVSRDTEGKPLRLVGTITDIAERHERENELRLAATVFNIVDEAMVVTDHDNRIITVNPAFTTITGYLPADVIGKNPRILSSGLQSPEFYKNMWDALNIGGNWQGEIVNRRKDGKTYIEWLSIKSVCCKNGNISNYVAAFFDISARKAAEEQMDHLAHFDKLTDLPNRELFADRLRQALAQARRDKESLAIMFLDLDKFKPVNDTLGHSIGDLLLKEVAARLQACMQRESDTVSRIGGDEFMILLSRIEEDRDAVMVAEKILHTLNQLFNIGSHNINISVSIGIAIYPKHGEDADQLIKNADVAMYRAKESGRNGYRIFNEGIEERVGD
jgi:diguanylate cyclase (GGDEF)-like protein/PAS domain S-box-containing protein